MSNHYYNAEDLGKFASVGEYQKEMADKFFSYYGSVFAEGALTAREKSLIGYSSPKYATIPSKVRHLFLGKVRH